MHLPALSAREVIRILERANFRFIRSSGGHRIFARGIRLVVVPYHPGDLKIGTVHAIIKATGMTQAEFLTYR